MRRWILGAGLLGLAGVAALPAEPAGACSVFCRVGSMELELVEVRLVEAADPDAEPPAEPLWPLKASVDADGWMTFPNGDAPLRWLHPEGA